MNTSKNNNHAYVFFAALLLCALAFSSPLLAQPLFSKSFTSDTIGPGSVSRLIFSISNPDFVPATELSFVDNLPAGVTIATPANPSFTCGGVINAPDGGSTITFSDGQVGASDSCSVAVDVISSVVGTHMNVSGDLTSSAGNSGTATDDLVVDTARPGFSKSFSPSTLQLAGRSTLTFTIDNSANASNLYRVDFSDDLPVGLVVASPSNALTTCASPDIPSPISAEPGATSISFSAQGVWVLTAGSSCVVSVDVKPTSIGALVNSSGELFWYDGLVTRSSGKANAALEVSVDELSLTKDFIDDPAIPGDTAVLEFEITNRDRDFSATSIAFTDDLDATLSGLAAQSVDTNECGASVDIVSSPGLVEVSGGSLGPNETCKISLTLGVPAGSVAGSYPNTTSNLTADVGGDLVVSSPASETLFVDYVPLLSKTFIGNPVGVGGQTTMAFTVTNTDPSNGITNIEFSDDLGAFIPGLTVVTSMPLAACGGNLSFNPIDQILQLSGGALGAGGSCNFQVEVALPDSTPGGTQTNTTSQITADGGAGSVVGKSTSASLTVIPAPSITKSFLDDPVLPGDTVTLEFVLTHDAFAPGAASNIGFSDDLDAVLSGLAVAGPESNNCGGAFSGTNVITLTGGGPLNPGASCTLSVPVSVPAAALPGVYLNTSSQVTADVTDGVDTVATVGPAAQDQLSVGGLTLTKRFIGDPVIPGREVLLSFTLDNSSGVEDASSISFTDDLGDVLSGLQVTAPPLPAVFCGGTLSTIGGDFLQFSGGSVLAGAQCSFELTLEVPVATASGDYLNATSSLTALIGGSPVGLPAASDILSVDSDVLFLSKNFLTNPVMPGSTVDLEFQLSNLNSSETLSDIAFTDDLNAALSGLVATGLPQSDICGSGSQVSGTGLISFSGGVLGPGETCTFSVSLQVPAAIPSGTQFINTTSSVAGMTTDALAVSGSSASDSLSVQNVAFSKSFSTPAIVPGGSVQLTFNLNNLSATDAVSGLVFLDDLNSMMSGAVATGLPAPGFCGPGSTLTGTSLLTLSDASLPAGGSCVFLVDVTIPASAEAATYNNQTTSLTSSGLIVAAPAEDTLIIPPPPTFSKLFDASEMLLSETSRLTFTIDNSGSVLPASSLSFTDNLPAGLLVATPANASTTCSGGTLAAVSGAAVLTYSGGSVTAGGSCTVAVDVAASTGGVHNNVTSDLTSNLGTSSAASDSIAVIPPPAFNKVFSPADVSIDDPSRLTFVIDNSASYLEAADLSFTDNLPAGMFVAAEPAASSTCTGGTLIANPGGQVISYTGGMVSANASCTVAVTVVATGYGLLNNVTSELSSNLGNAGPASATLRVIVVSIPTINDWGLLILSILLGMAGLYYHNWRAVQRSE